MENMSIGERIRTLRLQHNMKRSELAELLEVSPSTIAAYENGDVLPPVLRVSALADIFSVSLNMMIFGTESGFGSQSDDK